MRRALRLPVLLAVSFLACSSSPSAEPSGSPGSPATSAPPMTGPPEVAPVQPADDAGTLPSSDAAGGSGEPSKPPSGQLGILSQNLHCLKTEGTAFVTNEARFDAIAAVVVAEKVDVILAQEVCASGTANARSLLLAALQKATGAAWSSTAAFAHRAWEGTPDEADESVAIFARGSLSSPHELVHRVQGSLRRVTLGATLASPLTTGAGVALPVRLYTVHLDHAAAAARAGQAREVASAAMVETDDEGVAIDVGSGAVALPILVAGDFNAQSGAEPPKALVDFGFVEASGSAATARIDHVFTHRSAPLSVVATKEVFTGAAAVSDHPGVVVRFAGAAPKSVRLTRVVASGTLAAPVSLRGDRAPLSWDHGWPAFSRPASGQLGVAVVTSELPTGAFTYKFLRNDTEWASGSNLGGMGGTTSTSTPSFP